MLSFTIGKPIAKIVNAIGNADNNKIIKVNSDIANKPKEKEIKYKEPYDLLSEDKIKIKSKGKMSAKDKSKFEKWFDNAFDSDEEMNQKYPEIKKEFDNKDQKEMILYKGQLEPVPSQESRDILFIAGPSNSGKSTYAAKYSMQYKRTFPRRKIYVFSRITFDEAFDEFDPIYIKLNDEIIENPLDTKLFVDSLIIFDDIDTIQDDEIRKEICKFRNDILETGRHQNISIVITSHQMSNYQATRIILNEAQSITFYPKSGSTNGIVYVLKKYVGMSKDQINRIFEIQSRWVTVVKIYPMCVFYETGIYIL